MQSRAAGGGAVATPHLNFIYPRPSSPLALRQQLELREDGSTWGQLLPGVDYSVACGMDERWAGLPEPQSRLCKPADYLAAAAAGAAVGENGEKGRHQKPARM
jgi:hypothetical protein